MDLKEIEKKYPKGFELFKKSAHSTEVRWEAIHKIAKHNNWRGLFDFFDEQGIFINMVLMCEGYIGTLLKDCCHPHIKENRTLTWKYSRKEAEIEAWTKAFEILENKLKV